MKKLIAVPYGVAVPYDLSGDDVVRVNVKDTDNNFTIIARCGIALEEHLLKDGRTLMYTDSVKYPLAGIIWKTPTDNFVDESLPWIQNIRGDELLFPSLHFEKDSAWAVGNPRALIKWAANCVNLNMPSVVPAYRFKQQIDQQWLVWLAHRIGLKAYGQTK